MLKEHIKWLNLHPYINRIQLQCMPKDATAFSQILLLIMLLNYTSCSTTFSVIQNDDKFQCRRCRHLRSEFRMWSPKQNTTVPFCTTTIYQYVKMCKNVTYSIIWLFLPENKQRAYTFPFSNGTHEISQLTVALTVVSPAMGHWGMCRLTSNDFLF